ncbi:MAG: hypothetical protein HY770_00515 [Chitinivibrionia bacterium]|nr:hypothetical protein [Chitinivibrionia bacterium]
MESPHRTFIRHVSRGVPYLIIGAAMMTSWELRQDWVNGYISFRALGEFFYSASLLPPYLFDMPTMNRPAWAMSVFVLGYFIDAYYGRKISSQSTVRSLLAIMIILCFISFFILIYLLLIPITPGYPPRAYCEIEMELHVFPFFRIFEVLLGMFIGSLIYRHYWEIKESLGSYLLTNDMASFLILLFNMGWLVFLCQITGQVAFLATHGLMLAPMSFLLVAMAVDDNWLGKIGLTRLFKLLANLSLPIYLLHIPTHTYYQFTLKQMGVAVSPSSWWFVGGYFAVLIVVSFFVMALVNYVVNLHIKPFLRRRFPVPSSPRRHQHGHHEQSPAHAP